MVQVLLPARLLQEAAACAVLGAALGAVRAFLPVRGRAAFVPDVLLSGAVLLVWQVLFGFFCGSFRVPA